MLMIFASKPISFQQNKTACIYYLLVKKLFCVHWAKRHSFAKVLTSLYMSELANIMYLMYWGDVKITKHVVTRSNMAVSCASLLLSSGSRNRPLNLAQSICQKELKYHRDFNISNWILWPNHTKSLAERLWKTYHLDFLLNPLLIRLCCGLPCRWTKYFFLKFLMQWSRNFDNNFNFQVYLIINTLRTARVEDGTTKFRANPLHDQNLHQNWNKVPLLKQPG